MTPRVRMVSTGVHDTADEIIEISARTGFSRLPVLDDGPDDIVGLVHVKRAFAVPLEERGSTTAAELMSAPTRVPETLGADRLLTVLRGSLQLAIVTDEHGGTAGIVTLKDLVEELVGELEDEHDRARSGVTRRGRSMSFDASWRPDELLDRTGVHVPTSDDWDTVAGFVVDALGRLPEPGDEIEIDSGSLRVERVDGTRIVRLAYLPHALLTDETGKESSRG